MWWEWKLTFSFQISPQRLLQGDDHAGNIKRPHNAMAYSSNPPITKWTLTINAATDTRESRECKRRWLARCWTPSSSWKHQTEARWKVNNSRNTFSWDIRRPSENWPSGDQLSGGAAVSSIFAAPLIKWSADQTVFWSGENWSNHCGFSFDLAQWQQLHQRLKAWYKNQKSSFVPSSDLELRIYSPLISCNVWHL